jgi:parallel beta-helix repeat protein
MITSNYKRLIVLLVCLVSLFQILYCDLFNDEKDDENISNGELLWIECKSAEKDSTIYYVSPIGNDRSNGTSENTAFKTIARAFQAIKVGGTIRILLGTYNESIGLLSCGNATSSITIEGYYGIPKLDGKNKSTIGIYCEQCSNLIFRNLLFENYTDIGIGASLCNDITFQNLTIRENGHAVQLKDWELEGYGIHVDDSENILIENNDVYRNGPDPQIVPNFIMGTGINTYGNKNVVIRNNQSYKNIGGGILVEDSDDVLVEDNHVYENDLDASVDEWWDGGLWVDGGKDVIIRNNIFENNFGPGIEISDEDLQKPTGYILENNVSRGNYYGIFVWNFGTTDWPADSIISRSGNQFLENSRLDVWIVDWF